MMQQGKQLGKSDNTFIATHTMPILSSIVYYINSSQKWTLK